MIYSTHLHRIFRWFNLPTGVLLALLQRTPLVQMTLSAAETMLRSPAVDVLKATIVAAVSLGAIDTVAGATTLTSSGPSPLSATAGTSVSVAFGVLGTQTPPESWSVGGSLPPGMAFYNTSSGTAGAFTSGIHDAGTLFLRGTPTTAGSFTVNMMAFQNTGGGGFMSPSFNYTVNVAAAVITAPTITTNPVTQSAGVGDTVMLSVTATGTGDTYQWQKNGANISGATNAFLSLANVQTADSGSYTVIVTNMGGSVTSTAAVLTVQNAVPKFTISPVSEDLGMGSDASFSATVTGGSVTYQWQKGGAAISGATSATLTLTNIQSSDAGTYTLVATNSAGSTSSPAVTLTVESPIQGRIVNLSVRSQAGTGSQTLITGFGISGTNQKSLLIRGSGPTLGNFGVTGFVQDPIIDLFQGSSVITENDNWGTAPNQAAILAAGGNMEGTFTLDSKDSIILASLPPIAGGYTTQLKTADNSTGVALVELFDTDSGTPGTPEYTAQSRLTNISARSQVGTGDNILITGFVINGNMSKHLMIRASGPTLTNFGVTGVLVDPILRLYKGSTEIAENDDWMSSSNVAAIMAGSGQQEGSFTLNNKDSIIWITLPPGVYTAQVSGVNNTTGVALVEVFDLQ